MTHPIKVQKSTVRLSFLFIFSLGIVLGFLLDFREAENQFQRDRQSLEDTAKCLVPYVDC